MQEPQQNVRPQFLGEIETEIVGAQYHQATLQPGEQANLERDRKNAPGRRAILVENGHCEPVGYLPRQIAHWLAPLVDRGQIHLDGYMPQISRKAGRCPLVVMVFQGENGQHLLEKAEPHNEREALHQTVLQAYQSAQAYRDPKAIKGLVRGLRPLEKQKLLPETRLLLALLPRLTHEMRASQGIGTMAKFRNLLSTLTIGPPSHHHNLTFFPLLWPEVQEPSYKLLSTAIEAGEAVVEEVSESGSVPNLAVTNHCKWPLLIPEGEILMGAKQNRVINVTVLVAPGVKFVLPVSCVEAGRWRYQSRHFQACYCAPPSLRNKKLKAVHRNRAERGVAASDQGEVWDEVQKCLDGVRAQSPTASLTDAFVSAEETLKEHCKKLVLPEGAAGVLVARDGRIIGMDLFDSPTTLKTLWGRLSDAYLFDALRNPSAAEPTPVADAQRFVERIGGAARPRSPALALGEELEITGEGLVGAALLYDGGLCHLAAFSDEDSGPCRSQQ
jgi:hypothetical protein